MSESLMENASCNEEALERRASNGVAQPKVVRNELIRADLRAPEAASRCPGIELVGQTIRTLAFSTDLYIIRNCNADAVLAAAPFTCQPVITQALLQVAGRPILAGVTGATTSGARSVVLAMESESQGVSAVVANMSAEPELIRDMTRVIDIPIVATIGAFDDMIGQKIDAGARILNVAAGRKTSEVVAQVRAQFPDIPIIATAGPSEETAAAAIEAGADALSWTPPSCAELERETMRRNREMANAQADA